MSAGALAGFVALVVAAFGLRTVLHRRRTGTTGWLTPPSPAAWVGDGLFALGAGGTAAAPALDLFDVLGQIGLFDKLAVAAAGAALLAGGAALALTAQAQMGAAWRAGIELSSSYDLVRGGMFRVVRNPFYVGVILASAGVALMVPNFVSFAGGVALVLGCQIDVRLVEEPHLRAVHGKAFLRYEASVPRFVPKPWLLR